ncbi:prolyl oligopeptidase family serine peptidase [uncultured Kordia sp.]|uniref:prolyl oligopeptidase family serine peptidase n=1 Tax=uncultured Kordia sp. TaxID=507699 RepID=UPI00261074FE|nr:prolyl oligopeptidase family serine peptidase [uncultured Kordia sp.]
MEKYIRISLYLILFFAYSCNKQNSIPHIDEKKVVDVYFGKEIEDPFRHLENLKDSSVISWLKLQKEYSDSFIDKISNHSKIIKKQQEFESKNGYKISSLKITSNGSYFYLKKLPNDKVAKLYFKKNKDEKEELIYDPNEYKKNEKEQYLINHISPNWSETKIAISLTKNDEEVSDMIILDLDTKKIHDTIISKTWAAASLGMSWLPDDSGFIFSRLPSEDGKAKETFQNTSYVLYDMKSDTITDIFSKVINPKLGIEKDDFPIIFLQNQNDKYIFGAIVGVSQYFDVYYKEVKDIKNVKAKWIPLFKKEDKVKRFTIVDDNLIYLSAKEASNFKIYKANITNNNISESEVLVNEKNNATIRDFAVTNSGLFYTVVKNGVESKLYHYESKSEIKLPISAASISLISNGHSYNDLWVSVSGWNSDYKRYSYNFDENTFLIENLLKDDSLQIDNDLIVEELEVLSHDGKLIPLSLVYKKGLKKNGQNRVLMRGYGAYGYVMRPKYSNQVKLWTDEGGIYVVAHVRGGGEKGDSWYKDGFKTTKPNTWRDLISCTEYLIKNNYTSNKHVAIWGNSAGGIMIGRAITERPDLFAAAIVRVGVLNALRSENMMGGGTNSKEYGTVKDSIEFKALLQMDAYHNIIKGESYPAMFLTAGMNDTRVAAWQPAKFAAKIQKANTSKNPILLSVDFESGHGFDASAEKKQKELADIISFALWQTGHPNYQIN